MNRCVFCKETRFPYHKDIMRDNSDTILYSDDHVFITPDINPICCGHVLIITHRHFCNFAHTDMLVRQSIKHAVNHLCSNIYRDTNVMAFEHGSVYKGEAGNSVDHAHIHVVPVVSDMISFIINDNKYVEHYIISSREAMNHKEERPYLAIYSKGSVHFFIVENIPSQYLRFIFAMSVGMNKDVNWRTNYIDSESINLYDQTILLFTPHIQKILPETNTLNRLSKADQSADCAIDFAFNHIRQLPYNKCTIDEYNILFDHDYEPGLFYISERKKKPSFLLEENSVSYDAWFIAKLASEIIQIESFEEFHEAVFRYGLHNLLSDVYWIFNHIYEDGHCNADIIMNQLYSDMFRRSIMYLITNSPFTICNNHENNNRLVEKAGLYILSEIRHYTLHERLRQTLYSGVIGMNLKESLISTSPVSLSATFTLNTDDHLFEGLSEALNSRIVNEKWVGIDDYYIFKELVIDAKEVRLCWITDDYLATMFELKFIEEILTINKNLTVTVIPRYDSYSNDASYSDVIHFLTLKPLTQLSDYYNQKRFRICRNGCDVSTFDGTRMSSEVAKIIIESDYAVISGARAFEMARGIKKDTFYTGIAVCKGYTESVTGFDRDEGALVFLYQPSGEKAFSGFRNRHLRLENRDKHVVAYAQITARDYVNKREENSKPQVYSQHNI